MTKLICVGACYLDTILSYMMDDFYIAPSVPYFPEEDSKLRATSLSVRRGGNCPNSLEVLQQLLVRQKAGTGKDVTPYLISCLPSADSLATRRVIDSFGPDSKVDFTRCVYRNQYADAASSYIIRSEATGSRTLVNYNDLPEMTVDEFVAATTELEGHAWFHFEGRMPDTTYKCIQHVRDCFPEAKISVEVEKPGRVGLEQLAAEADVVFYSKSWAQVCSCLR